MNFTLNGRSNSEKAMFFFSHMLRNQQIHENPDNPMSLHLNNYITFLQSEVLNIGFTDVF